MNHKKLSDRLIIPTRLISGCCVWRKRQAIMLIISAYCSACGNNNGNDNTTIEQADVVAHIDSSAAYAYQVEVNCAGPSGIGSVIPYAYLITDSCAGPFSIGAVIPDSVEGFVMTKSHENKATPDKSTIAITSYNYEIGNEGRVIITPMYDSATGIATDKTGEIFIYSDLFLTDGGIGAMSSINQFASVYPDLTIRYAHEDSSFVVETPQLRNVQFLLDSELYIGTEPYSARPDSVILKISDFKEGTCFTAIRLSGSLN